jgi:hypothetical protein
MKTSLLILIAIGSLAGCAKQLVAVPVDLGPCPIPPDLVRMTDAQYLSFANFAQANPDTVKILQKREDQLQAHIDTLCGIIESTSP